jgi:hypothetical protein
LNSGLLDGALQPTLPECRYPPGDADKPLRDEAIRLAKNRPQKVVIFNRGIDKDFRTIPGRDLDYARLRDQHLNASVPVTWFLFSCAHHPLSRAIHLSRADTPSSE